MQTIPSRQGLTEGKMRTEKWALFLVLFATLLTSTGQLFYKLGIGSLSLVSVMDNYLLLLGLFLYITAMFLILIALKYGELSVLYPVIAMSYVWVALLSIFFLGEPVGFLKWSGVFAIVAGITLIGAGS